MALCENDNTEPPFNLDPSDDIQLNVFLLDISKEITDDDLQCMKFLLQGGSKRSVLAEIKTPLELFTHLRQRLLLTRNNLVVLQSFIWNLGNKKIFNKFIDFARTVGDALHFTVPRETPENGYMYLHFHIKGNLETFTRQQLEALRDQTRRLLGVPSQFVLVAGLQPSDSLILTLMIPDDCFPTKLDIKTEEQKLLLVLGVDRITKQNGEVIFEDCAVKCTSSPENVSNTDLEINRLLQKQVVLENELEKAHITILKQNRELSKWQPVEDEANKQDGFLMFLVAVMFNIFHMMQKPEKTPRWEESLLRFKRMLKKVKEKGYDEDIIQQLLEAHAFVVKEEHIKIVTIHELLAVSHEHMMRAQAEQISRLEYECAKLRYYNRCGETDSTLSEREDFFLKSIHDSSMQLMQVSIHVPGNKLLATLDQLSKELSEEEWKQIQESEIFSTEEMCTLKKDKSKLLRILFERHEVDGPIEVFLEKAFRKLKRKKELLSKLRSLLHKCMLQQQKQKNDPPGNRNGRRKKEQPLKKDNQENYYKEILDRITRLEGKLELNSHPLGSLMQERENKIRAYMEKYNTKTNL